MQKLLIKRWWNWPQEAEDWTGEKGCTSSCLSYHLFIRNGLPRLRFDYKQNEEKKKGKRKFWHSQNSLQHKFMLTHLFRGILILTFHWKESSIHNFYLVTNFCWHTIFGVEFHICLVWPTFEDIIHICIKNWHGSLQ